jgi:hypothetical protein
MDNPYAAPRAEGAIVGEATSRLYLLGRSFVASMAISMAVLSALFALTEEGGHVELYIGLVILCFPLAALCSIVPALLRDPRWFWPYLIGPLITSAGAFAIGYVIGSANP